MHPELYTDGISEITVSGTVVRADFVSLSPTERDTNNAPKSVFRQRLIFSIEGFANSVELMHKALQGLIDAGAVTPTQRRPAAVRPITAPAAEPAVTMPEKPSTVNASPNFS
jgi:hypothetical protein